MTGIVLVTDCVDYMKTCDSGAFDLVVADPPYFRIHGEFDYAWETADQYVEWSKTWITECHRLLRPAGSFYLWGKIGFGKGYPLFKIADWIESTSLFHVVNWITQRNSRGRGTKKGFMEAREELVFFAKSKNYVWNVAYTDEPSRRKDMGFDGKPRKNAHKRCSDVWVDVAEASQSVKERTGFPTAKALRLCDRIVRASSNPGDNVYIPFGGSGSEAVACERLGRRWVLTEKNSDYVQKYILPRLAQEATLPLGPAA